MAIGTTGELTVATLCTPVNGTFFPRPQSVRFDESIRPVPSRLSSNVADRVSEGSEGSDSLGDPLEAWAKYGFIELGSCRGSSRRKGKTRKDDPESTNHSGTLPEVEGFSATQARESSDSGAEASTSTTTLGGNVREYTGRRSGTFNSGSAMETGTAPLSSSAASAVRFASQNAPYSPEDSTTTPPTADVTPSSYDRSVSAHARTAAGQANITRARVGLPGPPRDSLAAAIVAATTSAASRAAAVAERVRKGEIERLKRDKAERLRACGCSRTLYPRICPTTESGHPVPLEVETERWIKNLRRTAPRCGVPFSTARRRSRKTLKKEQIAALPNEEQSTVRASLAADVSEMEGPDGLLHCAVMKGDHPLAADVVQKLVDRDGANVNSRDEWGRTPLHTACGIGVVPLARFFIRRGANVDALDADHRPPIFFACAGGHTTMARYLTRMEVGAQVNLRDVLGKLPGEYFFDDVSRQTQEEVAAVLVAVGWPDPPERDSHRSRGRSRTRGCARKVWTSRSRSQQRRLSSPRRSGSLFASDDGESLPSDSADGQGSGRVGQGRGVGGVAENWGSGRVWRRRGSRRFERDQGSGRVLRYKGSGHFERGDCSGRVLKYMGSGCFERDGRSARFLRYMGSGHFERDDRSGRVLRYMGSDRFERDEGSGRVGRDVGGDRVEGGRRSGGEGAKRVASETKTFLSTRC